MAYLAGNRQIVNFRQRRMLDIPRSLVAKLQGRESGEDEGATTFHVSEEQQQRMLQAFEQTTPPISGQLGIIHETSHETISTVVPPKNPYRGYLQLDTMIGSSLTLDHHFSGLEIERLQHIWTIGTQIWAVKDLRESAQVAAIKAKLKSAALMLEACIRGGVLQMAPCSKPTLNILELVDHRTQSVQEDDAVGLEAEEILEVSFMQDLDLEAGSIEDNLMDVAHEV